MTVTTATVHLDAESLADQMAIDVRRGLTASPKWLPPKYFYDARGSDLFDQITRLPEYYPTRTERAILAAAATDIAEATRARTLVELGSGTSDKTRILLTALRDRGTLERFAPFDVDPTVLGEAAVAIAGEYPGLEVAPIVGDFEHHLGEVPRTPRRLLAFLGSTIGNFDPGQRAAFLHGVSGSLRRGDAFLLGVDLVKDADRLVRAYDDAQGVTAAFNKNVFAVINRALAADFDPEAFEHVALWDAEREWIEMRLRATRAQSVQVGELGLQVRFDEGEELRTEISAKFRRDGITRELRDAGLVVTRWWTDPAADFGLLLAVPA